MCWQCKRDRVSDWVGRCIAESATSRETMVVTLTYGRDDHYRVDHPHSQMLHYRDVQLYLKRLRLATLGRVRFFCTGEYGSLKGRAHWHLILFFSGLLTPGVKLGERFLHDPWPDGWSFWETAVPENMRYCVKYLLKDQVAGHDRVHRMSSAPELGNAYFRREALRYVEQGLPPREFYRFPNDWDRFGDPREYRLSRCALYKFLAYYARAWKELHGDENWPQCELMEAYCDERARRARLGTAGDGMSPDDDFLLRYRMEILEKKRIWLVGENASGAEIERIMLYPGPGPYSRATRGG